MTFFQRILPLWLLFNGVSGCTNILITPGASADGSAIIAYNSDDVSMFGYLYHYPASEGKEGETIKLYDWNDGVSSFCAMQNVKRRKTIQSYVDSFVVWSLNRISRTF